MKSILACFSDTATVHDEGEALHGKKAIEGWIVKTIEKYTFQFKPESVQSNDAEFVVTMNVSGTFDGSPITLDYHFVIVSGKIASSTMPCTDPGVSGLGRSVQRLGLASPGLTTESLGDPLLSVIRITLGSRAQQLLEFCAFPRELANWDEASRLPVWRPGCYASSPNGANV